MTRLRFYLDENISPDIAEHLHRYGIDAVSARSIDMLGDSDVNHLLRAAEMGYVLCTHDADFLRIHTQIINHCGIVFSKNIRSTTGGWVRELQRLHSEISAEEMIGQVRYISTQ